MPRPTQAQMGDPPGEGLKRGMTLAMLVPPPPPGPGPPLPPPSPSDPPGDVPRNAFEEARHRQALTRWRLLALLLRKLAELRLEAAERDGTPTRALALLDAEARLRVRGAQGEPLVFWVVDWVAEEKL